MWIFGDRPWFISEDRRLIEHVPHDAVAGVRPFKTPVTNFFLLLYLSSLIPELSPEYLWFCDDFLLLAPLSEEDARTDRYLEDLAQAKSRGTGLGKESLWRTYDTLKRLGYPGYNFETHAPTYFTKRRVLEAYCDLRDFVTEDRWYGLVGPTAVLNHALVIEKRVPSPRPSPTGRGSEIETSSPQPSPTGRGSIPLIKLADEGKHVGFHHREFEYHEIAAAAAGKTFLNFDDEAYGPDMRRWLAERFPEAVQV